MDVTNYHAKYYAHELTRRRPTNDIGKLTASLQDAKVDLTPHQVEAALFAFKSPFSKGAILADEVGLGKTIEAGIILSQRWAERKRKLLIIAPASLRKQWAQELEEKFHIPSVVMDTQAFNKEKQKGNKNPLLQPYVIICSYHFAQSKQNFMKAVPWDMAVIDEAHKLRNVYKSSNKIAKTIKNSLLDVHKVLLTATPLQNSLLELYGLVSVIDEYAFGDLKSFKKQYIRLAAENDFQKLKERLAPLAKRTLRRQVIEFVRYTNRIAMVEDFYPHKEETKLYEEVSEYLREPRLYALPASQKHLMILILRKLLASSSFAIQNTLKELASKLTQKLKKQEQLQPENIGDNFERYHEIVEEWEESEGETEEEVLSEDELEAVRAERDRLNYFVGLAKQIHKNAKGEKLLTALSKGFEKLQEIGANRKAVIFTESKRTQEYLWQLLEHNGYSGEVVTFNGTNTDKHSAEIYKQWFNRHKGTDKISGAKAADKKQAIVDYFREKATLMVATEAAAEGINLQFCSLVVNYDLPWNPQRVEQRIGRCHRYGQQFDVVVINFLNKGNAADQRVYNLLAQKFKLFDGVFGASDEVLGSLESGMDFEKRIAQIYQECRTTDEIQEAFDNLQKELEPQIDSKLKQTRKQLLENFDEEVNEKLRTKLKQGKAYLNKYEFWLWHMAVQFLQPYARFNGEENSFHLETNPFPNKAIHTGTYELISANQNESKTIRVENTHKHIFRIHHPLAEGIIEHYQNQLLQPREVIFNYSGANTIITPIAELKGQRGWMQISLYTVKSFETEDYLLFAGTTLGGQTLIPETMQRFFSLPAETGHIQEVPEGLYHFMENKEDEQIREIINTINDRNSTFFDEELEKLENWADDMKLSLEKEIQDLDAEIKLKKSEARKTSNLQEKISKQRKVKELEKKRNTRRQKLFKEQDDVDKQKDELLQDIDQRLKQETHYKKLFIIKWQIK